MGVIILGLQNGGSASADEASESETDDAVDGTNSTITSSSAISTSSTTSTVSGLLPLPTYRMALLIVSNISDTVDPNEMSKATSLYQYLTDQGWPENSIDMYCPDSFDRSEGIANVSNVEDGFQNLMDDNHRRKEVLIYIADHGIKDGLICNFTFTDGNINTTLMNGWLDQMTYSKLTFIVTGNHSGLAGPEFSDNKRDIICSMGSEDVFYPDQFNITRGLTDLSADTDGDDIISFVEAYYSEKGWLEMNTEQVPELW